ncbi:unnamed protein product [Macrosiphum euphorbiae]|uniref:YqaJ viral recombinase domain-containing protein n=1 Tax=Macrosiphum euphorbiae TaxID=13131 RepID=A0AAV0Y9Y6_9HEMI|nr:unnamed protein product [Macrosiphum euphorbiae]
MGISTNISHLDYNPYVLILDVDNNICEQFNSVINKFLGGKRINYNQRSSYNTRILRILAAVVSFNSSEYLRAVKKHITQTSPGKTAKSFLSQIIKNRSACQKRRQLSTKLKYKVKRPKASSKPDKHYGNADILDGIREVDDPSFVKDMEQFLKTLYDVNRTTVEETTRYQAESENWRAERMIRLTASNFGRVCKMRRNTSCKNIVHSILYLTFNSKSVQYGRDMEDEAKTKFEENFGYKIKKCGLFIDTQIPYLAASPDTENEIEAVSTGKLKYCSIKENKLVLSKNHIYYCQIQGQLHISQKEQCFFIIYTTNWMSVQIIKYDEDFWSTQMVDKLKTFYLNCLLPEIVDPVYKYRFMKSDITESKIILQQMKISKQLF